MTRPLSAEPPAWRTDRPVPRRLLTRRLRSTRLTVVCGGSDDDRTELLRHGVMPLLQRRTSDSPIAFGGLAATVLPFPERRRGVLAPVDALPDFEVAVLIDEWSRSPLTDLQRAVAELLCISPNWVAAAGDTLDSRLSSLTRRLGARFLFLFDRFDDALAAAASNPEGARFLAELATVMRAPESSAHVLLSAGDSATERIDAYLKGCQLGDRAPLRLPDPTAGDDPLEPEHRPRRPSMYLVPPVRTERNHPADDAGPVDSDRPAGIEDRPASATRELSAAEAAPDADPPGAVIRPETARVGRWRSPARAAIAMTAVLAVCVGGWWALSKSDDGSERRQSNAVPTAATVPAGLPTAPSNGTAEPETPPGTVAAWAHPAPPVAVSGPAAAPVAGLELAIDPDEGGLAQLADDLARIAPLGLHVSPSSGWADSVAAPRLAILRYDALDALRRSRPGADLRLVTPLLVEELHFIVRADSPLTHVHDIEGAKINTGPTDGSRALTVQTVYQRLFNHALPAAQTSVAPRDAALRELLDTRGVDVMVIADAHPSAWLAKLPPERASAIKLLSLEPTHPASRGALRAYLPTTLRPGHTMPGSPAVASLGVMSFLVVAGEPQAATARQPALAGSADGVKTSSAPTVAQLDQLSRSLCRSRLALQRDGHPKWREWQPGLQLPAGWPYVDGNPSFRPAVQDCPS